MEVIAVRGVEVGRPEKVGSEGDDWEGAIG